MAKIRVIVADDDSHMMQYYHAILDKADDIKAVAATTVCSRVVFLATYFQPDVALIDYAMIPVDGFRLMAALHAELPTLSVILLGGRDHLREAALELGAVDYLAVPITPRNLLDAIRRIGRKDYV